METRKGLRHILEVLTALALTVGFATLPAAAQTQPTKRGDCHNYKLDQNRNRITFKNSRFFVILPEKTVRDKLRAQGTPGQIFRMKDCDTPDLEADVGVYSEADATGGDPAEVIPSAVRVVILAEKNEWVQVKGYTSLWQGTGWVHLDGKTLVIKY